MTRVSTALRKGRKAMQDLDLLKVLRSEITYEESSNRFQDNQSGSLGDFKLEWDSAQSEDVVLRKKCESGEEVAVSALLGPEAIETESRFPWDALIKVCIKKPGLSSILQFDCGVSGKGDNGSKFDIHNAYYIPSATSLSPSQYKGPLFSSLDPNLQEELKSYLVARGISQHLTNFLLFHLYKKEQSQYINWLRELESMVAQND